MNLLYLPKIKYYFIDFNLLMRHRHFTFGFSTYDLCLKKRNKSGFMPFCTSNIGLKHRLGPNQKEPVLEPGAFKYFELVSTTETLFTIQVNNCIIKRSILYAIRMISVNGNNIKFQMAFVYGNGSNNL